MNKNKKNILLVIAGLGNGGAEKQILKLFKLLNSRDYNCYLLILNKKEKIFNKFDWLKEDGRFLSLELERNESFLFFKIIIKLIKIYKEKRITHIISFLHIANMFTRFTKVFCPRIKIITSIRNDFGLQYKFKFKIQEYLLINLSKAILTNSKPTLKYLEKKWFVFKDVKYLPNIFDDKFKIESSQKNPQYTVISVGRLSPDKNYSFLLKLAQKLKDVDFVILGEGVLRDSIEKELIDKNINNVKLLGQVSNPYEYMSKSHLFFLPSVTEGISNSMIEAMSAGIPVLISEGANTSEIVEDNKTGFVFLNYNEAAVADKLNEIRSLDPKELNDIVENAKVCIKNEFNEENVLKIVESVL